MVIVDQMLAYLQTLTILPAYTGSQLLYVPIVLIPEYLL